MMNLPFLFGKTLPLLVRRGLRVGSGKRELTRWEMMARRCQINRCPVLCSCRTTLNEASFRNRNSRGELRGSLTTITRMINIEIMLELSPSPLKPGKPAGIRWSKRKREREDQSKQQRNALSPSRLLCALPLACHGMCNYSSLKVPVLACVCMCGCASTSQCLVTTLNPVNNAARSESTSESRSVESKDRVEMKTFNDAASEGTNSCSDSASSPPHLLSANEPYL